MATDVQPGKLTNSEYKRRSDWLTAINTFTKPEYIEIVRILKKQGEEFSENNNGIFFNVVSIQQETFDKLDLLLKFTIQNRKELADREHFLSTLITKTNLQ